MRCSVLRACPTPLAGLQPELEAVQARGRRRAGGHGAQAAAAHLAVPAGKRPAVPGLALLLLLCAASVVLWEPCRACAFSTTLLPRPCEHTIRVCSVTPVGTPGQAFR